MKNSFMRYGLYAGLTITLIIGVSWVLLKLTHISYSFCEIMGWGSIVVSLLFVYFGMRYYRDKQNGGQLTFWQGLATGMAITSIPAVCFGLIDMLYVSVVDPQFYEKYKQRQETMMKASLSPAEFAAQVPAMRREMDFFSQPWMDFIIMFLSVAAVGLIITVISAFILRRPAAKTAIGATFSPAIN